VLPHDLAAGVQNHHVVRVAIHQPPPPPADFSAPMDHFPLRGIPASGVWVQCPSRGRGGCPSRPSPNGASRCPSLLASCRGRRSERAPATQGGPRCHGSGQSCSPLRSSLFSLPWVWVVPRTRGSCRTAPATSRGGSRSRKSG